MIFIKSTQNQSHNKWFGYPTQFANWHGLFLAALLGAALMAVDAQGAESSDTGSAETRLDIYRVLQEVIDKYPSLALASLKVQQAQTKLAQIRGLLDWRLQASAGVAKEPGFFLGTTNSLKTNANFSRRLENGDSLAIIAALNRSDSEMSLSPTFPNPSYNTQVRINYRKPLLRDNGFASFSQDLKNAGLNTQWAQQNRLSAYEGILGQVIGIFYSINATVRQVENIHQSLERTKRLRKFIKGRLNLGIAENKDILQILAQIDSQNAQLQVLDSAIKQQYINLNRLLVNPWDTPLQLEVENSQQPLTSYQENIVLVEKHNPRLAMLDIQLQIANNNLEKIRDLNKDSADLVVYAGAQSVSGDSAMGSVEENDTIGGISLEYQINRGKQAKAAQQKELQTLVDMALVEKKYSLNDLQYDVAELVSGINLDNQAIAAYEKSVASEKKKLDDAEARYRRGRIDIDRVIGFENQLSAAELALEIQRIELEKRRVSLSVINGKIWNQLKIPEMASETDAP